MATTVLDQLLEVQERVDEGFRARRTTRDVDVDRHDPIDALDRRVAPLVATAGAGAVAEGDAPLWLGHLVPQPDERTGHLRRAGAGDDQDVGLARTGPEGEPAEAVHVVLAGRGRDHL